MQPQLPTHNNPTKPKSHCRMHGCSEKVVGSNYCEEHKDQQPQKWGTTNKDFYNSTRWRDTTLAYRKANPLCEQCLREGRTRSWKQTDHITPVSEGGAKFDWDNLQSLCNECHSRKTRKEMNR